MQELKILVFALFALVLTACPSKNSKSNPSTVKYVVMGDPFNTIAGAQLSTEGAFEALSKEIRLSAYAGVQFSDKQKPVTTVATQESLEAGEAPEKEFEPPTTTDYEIVKQDKNILVFKRTSFNNHFPGFSLTRDSSGHIRFADIENKKMQGALLHFSKSEDGTQFSLLFYVEDGKNQSQNIIALYLTNKFIPIQPGSTEKPYSYIEGPGIKFPWPENKQITLEICGNVDSNIQKVVEKSVAEWNQALSGIRTFTTKKSKEFYPFSDFRRQCIYFIDDFFVDADQSAGSLAEAIIPLDFYKTSIIDADILVYKKEFEKTGVAFTDPKSLTDINFTILHEIGHFLGLDHVFDSKTKSIMGYDFDVEAKLHPIDIEAVRALYK